MIVICNTPEHPRPTVTYVCTRFQTFLNQTADFIPSRMPRFFSLIRFRRPFDLDRDCIAHLPLKCFFPSLVGDLFALETRDQVIATSNRKHERRPLVVPLYSTYCSPFCSISGYGSIVCSTRERNRPRCLLSVFVFVSVFVHSRLRAPRIRTPRARCMSSVGLLTLVLDVVFSQKRVFASCAYRRTSSHE